MDLLDILQHVWTLLKCIVWLVIYGILQICKHLAKLLIITVKKILQILRRSQSVQDELDFPTQKSEKKGFFFGLHSALLNFLGKSKGLRFHVMGSGNSKNSYEGILPSLGLSPKDKVPSVDQSDVVIAFVPIVSRAGTDIEAALRNIPENRPVVFVVLHHTFDPNSIVPDSKRAVHRSNVFPVDLLFYEDQGLLICDKNKDALKATEKYFQDIKVNQKWLI